MEFIVSLGLMAVGVVVAFFWIAMPFLVMGTNDRLDKLTAEMAALRAVLEQQTRPAAAENVADVETSCDP